MDQFLFRDCLGSGSQKMGSRLHYEGFFHTIASFYRCVGNLCRLFLDETAVKQRVQKNRRITGCADKQANHWLTANSLHYGVVSLFVVSPGDGAPAAGFESPGPAAVPCGVPPGGGAFRMTLKASGVSLSVTGPPGGGAFSMTLKAAGKGPSEAAAPPGP